MANERIIPSGRFNKEIPITYYREILNWAIEKLKKIHNIEIEVVETFMDIDGYFHFKFYFVDRANSVEDWATIMREDGTVWIASDVENSEIMQAVKDSHYPQKIENGLRLAARIYYEYKHPAHIFYR